MWKTRTRNKILVIGLGFIALCVLAVLYGWLILKRPEAPAMLGALTGTGGIWAIINGIAIAWEKGKGVK